jgi:hypothetical protein
MKQVLLIIAVVALVGCGEAEHEAAPMVQAEQEDLLTYEDSEEAKAAVVINAPPPERSLEVQFLDGELKKADLEEVTKLNLDGYQLTELPKNLENLTQLKVLVLSKNQLARLPKGLEKLTQLTELRLDDNPDLTKAQIAELQKALPKCKITHNAKK